MQYVGCPLTIKILVCFEIIGFLKLLFCKIVYKPNFDKLVDSVYPYFSFSEAQCVMKITLYNFVRQKLSSIFQVPLPGTLLLKHLSAMDV